MGSIIGILNDTAVPNLLIVFGGGLLFLGFVGRFGTYVEIPPNRQRWAGGVGAFLLLVGIVFTTLPALRDRSNLESNGLQPFSQTENSSSQTSVQNDKLPSVVIDGPPNVPFGKTTYFTILSENAVRGSWSIGGFTDQPVAVDPLNPSHQIYVEPTEERVIDHKFTIVFIAYDEAGKETRVKKNFIVIRE